MVSGSRALPIDNAKAVLIKAGQRPRCHLQGEFVRQDGWWRFDCFSISIKLILWQHALEGLPQTGMGYLLFSLIDQPLSLVLWQSQFCPSSSQTILHCLISSLWFFLSSCIISSPLLSEEECWKYTQKFAIIFFLFSSRWTTSQAIQHSPSTWHHAL